MRALFAALLLLIAQPVFAEVHTGNAGNAFCGAGCHFAGYKYNCGTTGCTQLSMRTRVPHAAYDSDGAVSGREAYVWPGIDDNGGTGLWQTGFTIDTDGTGAFTYSAWWECEGTVTGNNTVQTVFDSGATLSLNADDVVDIDVRCTNCTAGMAPPVPALWSATVTDVTKGITVTKTGYNCQLPTGGWSGWWVTELGTTSNVNFGVLNFTNMLMNSANPGLSQTLQMPCTMGGLTCALFEWTTGAGFTGAEVNPSIPNATTDGFRLCWSSGGNGSGTGTSFATCSNDPTMSNAVGGRGLGF